MYNTLAEAYSAVVKDIVFDVSNNLEEYMKGCNHSSLITGYVHGRVCKELNNNTILLEVLDREIQKYLDLQRDNK